MGRKKSATPMRRVHVLLPAHLVERIDRLSERTGHDRTAVIRLAVDAWLDREERKEKRS
jgi:metal-responsive CopG/Arc/MetJ family transcriptional regulator